MKWLWAGVQLAKRGAQRALETRRKRVARSEANVLKTLEAEGVTARRKESRIAKQ